MAGSFSANFESRNSIISSINAESSSDEFSAHLSQVSKVGEVQVETTTDECFEKKWLVSWARANGQLDFPVLEFSRMTGQNVVSGDSYEVSKGGLLMSPIPSNFLNKAFDTPVVEVTVNSVPSMQNCDIATDCLVSYSAPVHEISSMGSTSLSTGQTVSVQGTKFGTKSVIFVNDKPVSTSFIDQNNLEFTVEEIKDNNMIQVWSPNNGFSVPVAAIGSAIADALSRNTASFGGATEIIVSGSGFDEMTVVKFDSVLAEISMISYSELKFSVPKTENLMTSDLDKTVIVENSRGDVIGNFVVTLTGNITPVISTVSTDFSFISGSEITIFGSNLQNVNSFFIGSENSEILNSTDSEIFIKTPPMTSGSYSISAYSEDGAAFLASDLTMSYSLSVSSISPTNSVLSALGGGQLTISGSGFEDDKTEVLVDGKESKIISVTQNQVVFEVASGGNNFIVENTGDHADHGAGFDWNLKSIIARVGDKITFKWDFSASDISGLGCRLMQMVSPTLGQLEGGFDSGARVLKGVYEVELNEVGVYYFSSGCVDGFCSVTMRGSIDVQELSSEVKTEYIEVQVSGKTAEGPVFEVSYDSGLTAVVDDVTFGQFYLDQELTLSGSNFGSNPVVKVSGYNCNIISSSSTTVVCKIEIAEEGPEIGVYREIKTSCNEPYHFETKICKYV